MTDRELMHQALEAMEWHLEKGAWGADIEGVAAALRERLAQPQRTHWEGCEEVHPECRKPEQEPVAQEWRYYFSHSGVTGKPDEVVGPCFTDRKEVAFGVGCFDQTALYTPPRREWVGLTEEEQEALWDEAVDRQEHFCSQYGDFADAIEAKLKEKNA